MAIEIVCDDCGNTYRVSDDKAGSRVKCRECGSKIDVPDNANDDLFDTEVIGRTKSSPRRRKSSNGPPIGVIIGGAAVAVVLLIGVVLFATMGRGGGQEVAQGDPQSPLPNSGPAPSGPPPGPAAIPNAAPANNLPSSKPAQPSAALPNSAVGGNQPAAALPNSLPVAALPGGNKAVPPPDLPGNAPGVPNNAPGLPRTGKKFGGFANADPGAADGAAGAGPDAPLPDKWNVKVDPAKNDAKIDTAKPLNVKIPKGAHHTDVLFPVTPSPYVALGSNSLSQQVREVWNLATKSKVGTVTNNLVHPGAVSALSPDGQYLASTNVLKKTEGVMVWACKTGKMLGELETAASATAVLFPSGDRLVAACSDGSARVWKLPSGDLEHDLVVDKAQKANMLAASPGGKYLAAVTDKSVLKMFDLSTGEVAGELPLPYATVFFAGTPDALSFSPDGSELAMVMPTGVFEKEFLLFNVADGKMLTKANLDVKNLGNTSDRVVGNRLEWFPDRSKLLWRGHHVLDAKLGGPVWSAPEENGSSDAPRKLLDEKRILIVVGGFQNPTLKTVPVPLDEIAASAKIVAEGGEASDAGLPPITKADLTDVTPIALGRGAPWTMQPDGSPAGIKVKNSMAIPKERSNLGGIYIARPHVGRAVLWYSDGANNLTSAKPLVRPGAPAPAGGPGTVDIDVFNLATGKIQASVPLAYPCAVLDVGPEGDCVAVRTTKPNDQRIDVYALPSGKPIAGWRPHPDQHSAMQGVKRAHLLDGEYCITQAPVAGTFQNGVTTMWKLPECKAIWRVDSAENFVISPGGKYVGFASASRYFFLEARTGKVVGELPLALAKVRCAFHPTGTHVAVLNADEVSHHVSIIDVATGKPTADFFVPHGSDWVQWCGDTHLLLDDQWLIDLKQQKFAWQYELKFGAHALTQPDGRHWFVSSTGLGDLNAFLSGAAIPEPAVVAKIDGAQLPDETLLKPGMQFGLQISTNSPMDPNLAQQVGDNFKAGLEKNGFSVNQNSSYVFVITTTQSNPNEPPMKFGNGGPFDPRVDVPIMNVTCEVALLSNGQAVWKNSKTMTNKTFIVFKPRDEEIGSFLTKQVWSGVAQHLTKFPVPKQAFGFAATAGLGQSVFAPGGTQPVAR